jgi:uncharacterized SAM-binding protein YcdF (DUF218 family)
MRLPRTFGPASSFANLKTEGKDSTGIPRVSPWRVGSALFLVLAALFATGWMVRRPMLVGVAALLVSEDSVEPSEVIVSSITSARSSALEAAALYRAHPAAVVVLTSWGHEEVLKKIRELGIDYPTDVELARLILVRSGVPSERIKLLPGTVDGTRSEIAAVSAFVLTEGARSVTLVTSRSHTARAKWLLSRELHGRARVMVRGSRFDEFDVSAWWGNRTQAREVAFEYLRWIFMFPVLIG